MSKTTNILILFIVFTIVQSATDDVNEIIRKRVS